MKTNSSEFKTLQRANEFRLFQSGLQEGYGLFAGLGWRGKLGAGPIGKIGHSNQRRSGVHQ